jgi:DMSO/TMAO reductase YedYZ molybdopterin-dependent catalytic subunit
MPLLLGTFVGACTQPLSRGQPTSSAAAFPLDEPSPSVTASAQSAPIHIPSATPAGADSASCTLTPIAIPTIPAVIPDYPELDPTTGLHVTGQVSEIDLEIYRLEVIGKVDHPLSLSYDDLRCMPKVEKEATLVCPGVFVDVASWAGASLEYVLQLAGIQPGATQLFLYAADGYWTSIPLEKASSEGNFLAYEWEGEPLPRLHGFPVRAVFPELQGSKWVKSLIRIEVR